VTAGRGYADLASRTAAAAQRGSKAKTPG
jgi:hypothetical protein